MSAIGIPAPWLMPSQRVAYRGGVAAMAAFERISELIKLHAKRLAPKDPKCRRTIINQARETLRALDPSRFFALDDHHLLGAAESAMLDAFHRHIRGAMPCPTQP